VTIFAATIFIFHFHLFARRLTTHRHFDDASTCSADEHEPINFSFFSLFFFFYHPVELLNELSRHLDI